MDKETDKTEASTALADRAEFVLLCGEWQSIDTAPKDGTEIIVRFVDDEDGGVEMANAWFDESWRRVDFSRNTYEYFSFCEITHWVPAPKLPAT